MATATSAPIDQRLAVTVAGIRKLIPAAEVRLFGSRARGQAHPDSDVDLVLHSSSEARRRAQEPGSVVHEAFSHGVLLDDQP